MRYLLVLMLLLLPHLASAEPATEYHIHLRTDSAGLNSAQLKAAYYRSSMQPQRLRQGHHQLVVTGFDRDKEKVYSVTVDDPRWFHAEVFNPDDGTPVQQQHLQKTEGTLRLQIPRHLSVETLVIEEADNKKMSAPIAIELSSVLPLTSPTQAIDLDLLAQQGVFPVLFSGDPANRVDMIVLSEGYTVHSLPRFAAEVENIVTGYFNESVYQNFQGHFNIWRVEVASQQDGTGYGSPINTRFRSYFNCFNIARLLCVNESLVFQYLYSVLPADAIDKVLVVVNSQMYGGAGGQVATISLAPAAIDLALHELGHSFAGLADEYEYGNCSIFEPASANATRFSNAAKWRHWQLAVSHVSSFQGAMYCSYGMYRPTYNSMMRQLGQPFYEVNQEAIVRSIYARVDPIDQVQPLPGEILLQPGEQQLFSAETLTNTENTIRSRWYLNDQLVSEQTEWLFDGIHYPEGVYEVRLHVHDDTRYVLSDPQQRLHSERQWQIQYGSSCSVPSRIDRVQVSGVHARGFRLSWLPQTSASHYDVYYWNSANGQWLLSRTISTPSVLYSNSQPGSTFYMRVTARNSCGEAPPSNYVTVRLPFQ
ncbi:M64 family metallopeptidase [Alkalimonas sp.]|uniref:M64 family metallopeptidase n=1 Tax=Alkalimonas sp. TaxID=1872453 RepID=UPI00263B4D4B|nr:M64 family metallopeptidase [Alkalimonas sp.]MCC5826556.1 hypothetical protein [Alkalimonas sp.]